MHAYLYIYGIQHISYGTLLFYTAGHLKGITIVESDACLFSSVCICTKSSKVIQTLQMSLKYCNCNIQNHNA